MCPRPRVSLRQYEEAEEVAYAMEPLVVKLRCIAVLLDLPEPSASYPAPRLLQDACRQLGRPWTRSLKTSSLHRQCDAVLRTLGAVLRARRRVERPSYVTALPPELQLLLLLHSPRFTTVCKWQDVLPTHELAWLRSMSDAHRGTTDAQRSTTDRVLDACAACADPDAALRHWRELSDRVDDVRKPAFVCHVSGQTFPLSLEGSVRLLQRTLRETPEWDLTFRRPMAHPVRSVHNLEDLSLNRWYGDRVFVNGNAPGRDTPAVWYTTLENATVVARHLLQTHTSSNPYQLPSVQHTFWCMWRPCEVRVYVPQSDDGSWTRRVCLRLDTRL